jgi:hypothetical protein
MICSFIIGRVRKSWTNCGEETTGGVILHVAKPCFARSWVISCGLISLTFTEGLDGLPLAEVLES